MPSALRTAEDRSCPHVSAMDIRMRALRPLSRPITLVDLRDTLTGDTYSRSLRRLIHPTTCLSSEQSLGVPDAFLELLMPDESLAFSALTEKETQASRVSLRVNLGARREERLGSVSREASPLADL